MFSVKKLCLRQKEKGVVLEKRDLQPEVEQIFNGLNILDSM